MPPASRPPSKLRNQPRVAVVTIGDGGTSRDFLEGLQLRRRLASPMVMIINNNQ